MFTRRVNNSGKPGDRHGWCGGGSPIARRCTSQHSAGASITIPPMNSLVAHRAALARRFAPAQWMRVSLAVALAVLALKVLAWALTGSVGLLSDALESLVNVAAALFGVLMLRLAAKMLKKQKKTSIGS